MTSTTSPAPVPAPGSDAAIKAGCECRLYDPEWLFAVAEIMFSVDTTGCPLHAGLEECLMCGKPGRGQPCDDCMNGPRTGAGGGDVE